MNPLIMAKELSKRTSDNNHYRGQFLHTLNSLKSKTVGTLGKLSKILQNVPITFNETCIKEGLLPKYIYIYIYNSLPLQKSEVV